MQKIETVRDYNVATERVEELMARTNPTRQELDELWEIVSELDRYETETTEEPC